MPPAQALMNFLEIKPHQVSGEMSGWQSPILCNACVGLACITTCLHNCVKMFSLEGAWSACMQAVHVGDRFTSSGNDRATRDCCCILWVANPGEPSTMKIDGSINLTVSCPIPMLIS